MKKIILIILLVFLSSCKSTVKNEPFIKLQSAFSGMGYKCRFVDNPEKFCRIYFTVGAYTSYVMIDRDFQKGDYNPHSIPNKFDYVYDGKKNVDDYKIMDNYIVKVLKSGEIQISDNIILYETTNQNIDEKFQGTFIFNDKEYTIKIDDFNQYKVGNIFTDGFTMNITTQYGIPIFQIDRNIISIGSSTFSEYPIYYFEFDNDNNLLLYPVIGDFDNIEPIKYTLKRQN